MLQEEQPHFNPFAVSGHFDDAEARLRYRLGQDAVPTLEGGRHLLYICPICKRPWYQAGRRAYPRLTAEQLTHLAATFHADVQAIHTLPRSLCAICSTVYLDGLFTIEEYRQGNSSHCHGYHLLWESASPPYTALVAIIARSADVPLRTLLQREPDTLTAPLRDVCAVLAWLETRPCPPAVRVHSDEERRLLAHRLPRQSIHGTGETLEPRLWCGYAWKDACLPLGDLVLVSLSITGSPLAPTPYAQLLHAWRVLARAMRTVL